MPGAPPVGDRITSGVLRYKLLPVICRSGWHSPVNFVPDKISRPAGVCIKPQTCKIAPGNFVSRYSALLCSTPLGPAFGCSKLIQSILSAISPNYLIRFISNWTIKKQICISQRMRSIPVFCLQVKCFKKTPYSEPASVCSAFIRS